MTISRRELIEAGVIVGLGVAFFPRRLVAQSARVTAPISVRPARPDIDADLALEALRDTAEVGGGLPPSVVPQVNRVKMRELLAKHRLSQVAEHPGRGGLVSVIGLPDACVRRKTRGCDTVAEPDHIHVPFALTRLRALGRVERDVAFSMLVARSASVAMAKGFTHARFQVLSGNARLRGFFAGVDAADPGTVRTTEGGGLIYYSVDMGRCVRVLQRRLA